MNPVRRGPPGRPSESFHALVRCIAVYDWPARDQLAWQAACRPGRLLDVAGPASGLAPATRHKRVSEWGRYLSFLLNEGELHQDEGPADRLTEDRVAHYIVSLRARLRASSVWAAIHDLSYTASLLAPSGDWAWIRRHRALPTLAEVRASRKPVTPPDPHQLLQAALRSCDEIVEREPSIARAIEYRNGVMVAFAVWSTLRRKNLAEIELGEHLRIGHGVMRLVFDDTVKNGVPIDLVVPAFLCRHLQVYLDRYRPILMAGNAGRALWINRHGQPLDYTAFRTTFELTGMRLIGKAINVHSVRHAYATSILDDDPRQVRVVSAGLAHRSAAMVNTYYDKSGSVGASRGWLRIIARRRGH